MTAKAVSDERSDDPVDTFAFIVNHVYMPEELYKRALRDVERLRQSSKGAEAVLLPQAVMRVDESRLNEILSGYEEFDAPDLFEIRALTYEVRNSRMALRSIAANTCCDKCQEAALVASASLRSEANNYHDAYRGARDDLLEWKQRALKAEANSEQLAEALAKEVNGPTFMGEPALTPADPKASGDPS